MQADPARIAFDEAKNRVLVGDTMGSLHLYSLNNVERLESYSLPWNRKEISPRLFRPISVDRSRKLEWGTRENARPENEQELRGSDLDETLLALESAEKALHEVKGATESLEKTIAKLKRLLASREVSQGEKKQAAGDLPSQSTRLREPNR